MLKEFGDAGATLDDVKFDAQGLVPVIAQDANTGEVLMLAWANREALSLTLSQHKGTYFSRSRNALWVKGETSGHSQHVHKVAIDCDGDAVLYLIDQQGAACHTGDRSCFHNTLYGETVPQLGGTLERVYQVIADRIIQQPEGSYVTKMHQAGLDRILKKIGEEAGEVIIAAKNQDHQELAQEAADLLFHTLFVLAESGVTPQDVAQVLSAREGKSGLRPPNLSANHLV